MQRARNSILALFVLCAVTCGAPGVVHAELSSENFQVEKHSIGGSGQTLSASSTNYETDQEPGGAYTHGSEGDDDNDSGGSGGSSSGGGSGDGDDPSTKENDESTGTDDGTSQEPEDGPGVPVADGEQGGEDTVPGSSTEDDPSADSSDEEAGSGGDGGSGNGTGGGSNEGRGSAAERDRAAARTAAQSPIVRVLSDLASAVLPEGVVRFGSVVKETAEKIIEPVEPVVRSSDVVGAGGGMLFALLSWLQAPFSVTNIGRTLLHAWTALVGFFTLRRRRRPWGTVYDSVSKVPLDPAYVQIFDTSGEKKDDAITDLDGRYGFLVPEGTYRITVNKTNYLFPSTRLQNVTHDVLYNNLYFGVPIHVSDSVAYDIPLDPKDFDWNQYEKMRTRQTRFIHAFDPVLVRVLDVFFYVGAIVVVWEFTVRPDLFSGVFLIVYALLVVYRYKFGKPRLYGTVARGDQVLSYAIIRVLRGDYEITSKVADSYGRFFALVPPGEYTVRVEDRVGEESYEPVHETRVTTKDGVINENIHV